MKINLALLCLKSRKIAQMTHQAAKRTLMLMTISTTSELKRSHRSRQTNLKILLRLQRQKMTTSTLTMVSLSLSKNQK